MLGSCQYACIPVVRIRFPADGVLVGGPVNLQFVHPFKIPAEGAAVAMQVEGKLALGTVHHAARFEHTAGTGCVLCQNGNEVLVGHGTGRILRIPQRKVRPLARNRQGPAGNEGVTH